MESKTKISNDSSSLELLKRKRGSIKARLTIFEKYVSKYPSDTLLPDAERDEIEFRISKMETLSLEYDDIQLQIECVCENPDDQYIERESFETNFINAMVRARALVAQCRRARSGSNGSQFQSVVKCNQGGKAGSDVQHSGSSNVRPYQIKLPTISLPKFDGNFQNWLEFRDTFCSLVHNNDCLDAISKFHYLRASLEGSASSLICSLELTSSNYPIAWDILLERFDNNRLLVNNYVKALFDAKQPRETSKDLRDLVDIFNKNLRSLKALGEGTEGWDTLLVYVLTTKLDSSTLKEWETHRGSLDRVDYNSLNMFMKKRADLLESLEGHSKSKQQPTPTKPHVNRGLLTVNNSSESPWKWKCVVCKGDHTIYHCVDFLKEPISKRKEIVTKLKICQNCLRVGHTVNDCRHSSCRVCNKRHNSLLHAKDEDNSHKGQAENSKLVTTTARTTHQVLLSTACVKLFDKNGNAHNVRCLLDCGSTSCFVTEKLAKILQPDMMPVETTVVGLNNCPSSIANKCVLQLQSIHDKYQATIDCYVIPYITEPLPAHKMNLQGLQIPSDIELADPKFKTPGDIDLLLGADIFWNLIETRRVHLGKNQPTLQETKLGWVVSGSVCTSPKIRCHLAATIDIQDQLTKFWELEEVCEVKPWSEEEHICEKIFKETTERLSDGRFLVQVPLKQDSSALGDSFSMAERRFLSLERKLHANPKLFTAYKEFLDEYESMGHMSRVAIDNKVETAYYLPHHAVIREDSLTTKLRVVFDASAKTSNGISFNDIQLVGPVVQDDILGIYHHHLLSS